MKNIVSKWSSFLLAILIVLGTGLFGNEQSLSPKELSIIFTHDMHSHFTENNSVGGFARLKTAIDSIKKSEENVLTVDAGDFSMGTLFQTIYSKEAPELRIMGALGFDATTLGNHEFDYRAQGLVEMMAAAKASNEPLPHLLSSNINWELSTSPDALSIKKAMENFPVHEYIVLTKGNIKIAVFGQLGKDADACAPMSSLTFYNPVDNAKRIVKEIKANEDVDVIVCLSHGGIWEDKQISEDEIIAKNVPEIDVIVSGHTHSVLEKPILIGNTWVVCSGEYTNNVGFLTLVQNKHKRWDRVGYEIIPLNNLIAEETHILKKIDEFKKQVQEQYLDQFGFSFDQVLAVSPFNFTPIEKLGRNQEEDSLGNVITDAYIYAVKQAEGAVYEPVDFAVTASGIIRDTFAKGDITVANAFNVSSLGIGPDQIPGYPLLSIYLTGKEIKAAAEVDASVAPIMDGAQLYVSGASYEFNPNRLFFNKVTSAKQEVTEGVYKKIDDTKLYRVVSGLYSAQMLGAVEAKSFGLLSITAKTKNGEPITNFEDHIIYSHGKELKEWVALAQYLTSFEKVQGVSVIPEYYNQTHNRKIVTTSKNIFELLKSPNKVMCMLLAVVLVIICIVVFIIYAVRKVLKKRLTS